MSIRRFILLLVPFVLFFCNRHNVRDDDPNTIAGRLVDIDGNECAPGAVVRLFDATTADRKPVAITVAADHGRFSFPDLSPGIYRIWVEQDSLVLFIDSLILPAEPPLNIVAAPGPASTVSGVVAVEPHDNPATVTITPLGTGKTFLVKDYHGAFQLTGLAPGTYGTLFESTLPGYIPTIHVLSVPPHSGDTVTDTIRLTYTGIPVLTGIGISQDTLAGTICLSWNKPAFANLRDYVVYKDLCSAVDPAPEPFQETTDTFFIDQLFSKTTYPDYNDTIPQCFKYRVAIRTIENTIGSTNGYAPIRVVPQAMSWTYTDPGKTYEGKPFDTVSIDDTIVFTLFALNRTRALRSFAWFDPQQDIIMAGTKLPDSVVKEWHDSIRYAFHDTGMHYLYGAVIDDAGREWWEQIKFRTVIDTLGAIAGNDTGVFTGGQVHLHGRAFHRFGSVPVQRWKIGEAGWDTLSGPDMVFTAPDHETVTVCILSITDEDGTTGIDTMRVYTSLKVIGITAGANHTLLLKADSTLWTCGDNTFGQLGDGTLTDRRVPVPVMKGIRRMAAGDQHSLMLKNDGTLYACGSNSGGQFGDGTTEGRLLPVRIMSDVRQVAAGGAFSLILKNDASLWFCGLFPLPPEGDTTAVEQYHPVEIMNNIREIAAGERHILMVTTDNVLWSLGDNRFGQLGDGSTINRREPVEIMRGIRTVSAGRWNSFAVTSDGTVYACGSNSESALGITGINSPSSMVKVFTGATAVAAGNGFTFFLKEDHTLYACGDNSRGQLGDDTYGNWSVPELLHREIYRIAAGGEHSVLLKTDGSLWACGTNMSGQLGTGSLSSHATPVRMVPYAFTR